MASSRSTIAFVVTLLLVTIAAAEWTQLDTTKSIVEEFAGLKSSFDVNTVSWPVCMKRVLNISADHDVEDDDFASTINDMLSSLGETGGALFLNRGTYNIGKPIIMPSRTCLIGNSTMTDVIIKVKDNANFPEGSKGVIYAAKGEYVSISTLKIDANSENQAEGDSPNMSGVYFELINYAWIRNVHSTGHSHHGFDIHGSDGRKSAHGFYEGCTADYNKWAGFKFASAAYGSLFNSISQFNGRAGIAITKGAKSTLVLNNKILNNGRGEQGEAGSGCGAKVESLDGDNPVDVVLQDNNIVNATVAGLCLADSYDVLAESNSITNVFDESAYCYKLNNVRGFQVENTVCMVVSNTTFYPGTATYPTITPSPSPSLSPSPSPSPSTSRDAQDPGCRAGIASADVCCSSSCGFCGGPTCEEENGDGFPKYLCCPAYIKNASRSCNVAGPPCFFAFA